MLRLLLRPAGLHFKNGTRFNRPMFHCPVVFGSQPPQPGALGIAALGTFQASFHPCFHVLSEALKVAVAED